MKALTMSTSAKRRKLDSVVSPEAAQDTEIIAITQNNQAGRDELEGQEEVEEATPAVEKAAVKTFQELVGTYVFLTVDSSDRKNRALSTHYATLAQLSGTNHPPLFKQAQYL